MKRNELARKTLSELRDLAKSRGLVGYSRLRRAELIDGLLAGARSAGGGRRAAAKPKKGGAATRGRRATESAKRPAPRVKPAARKSAARSAHGKSGPEPVAGKASARPVAGRASARPSVGKAAKPKRRAKRPRRGEPSSRGLSPRTRRAFTTYRPLGEQRIKASKYYLGVTESPELDESFEYPETYGESAIALMVRDPYWLFAYWEFAPDLRSDLAARIGEDALLQSRLVLRVYDVTGTDLEHPVEHRDIDIAHGARNWYINVMRVEREYCVDVGVITPDGSFIVIARSNRVTLPPVGPSDAVDEEWVTLESLEEVYRQVERGPTSGSGGWGSGGWGSGGWRQ